MTDRKDLRVDRLIEVYGGAVGTDGYLPFVFDTNVGEVIFQIKASNMAGPLGYINGDVRFQLTDAPETILQLEFNSRNFAYVSRIELLKVPPLIGKPSEECAEPLVIPLLPVVALERFVPPPREDDTFLVTAIREVFLEVIPGYYRISWEREPPSTIFDCDEIRYGSFGAKIVCLDIKIADLDRTDEFDERVNAGSHSVWEPATISDRYLKFFDQG